MNDGAIDVLIPTCNRAAALAVTLTALAAQTQPHLRTFLLAQVAAPYCLFLDDDVIIESDLVERMARTLRQQRSGFVGSALHGLSHAHDVRQRVGAASPAQRRQPVPCTAPAGHRTRCHARLPGRMDRRLRVV